MCENNSSYINKVKSFFPVEVVAFEKSANISKLIFAFVVYLKPTKF